MANQFDFASLGNIFGGMPGATPTGLDALLTEDQRKLLGRNAALSAAGALLQASGRSAVPISMGQALGSALQAGQQGYQQARAGSFQDLLLGQKLQEAKAAQELQKQVAGVLTGPTPTVLSPEMQALAAPGMQAGPTMARAELAANIPQPSANEIKAAQYQRIADIYATAGKGEDAKRYQDIARDLNPRAEVVGQPFEVTDPKGNPILVQQYKSGDIKTMQGFGPKRDVVLQNLGGQTVAVNKSSLKGGETFAQTMTPSEIANLGIARANLGVAQAGLGLRQREFDRSGFDRVDTAEGFFNVPKGGGVAQPIMGPSGQLKGVSGGKPTEGETNAAGFAQRMELAQSIFQRLPAGSQPGVGTRMAEAVPFVGGALARGVVQSADTQMYDQAAQDWIRAKLRKESGAAIGVDEARQEYATYFPMVGDSAEKIAQKAEARRVVTLGMQKAAGKAYEPYTPLAPAPTAPAAQPMMSGVPTWDPVKKQYVYQ
jgi:hypothetical protein